MTVGAHLLPKQHITPNIDVNDSKRSGKKARGIRIIPQTIFQLTISKPGTKSFMESAKRTIRATQAESH